MQEIIEPNLKVKHWYSKCTIELDSWDKIKSRTERDPRVLAHKNDHRDISFKCLWSKYDELTDKRLYKSYLKRTHQKNWPQSRLWSCLYSNCLLSFLTVLTPFSLRNRRGRNQQRAEDACILRLTAEMCNHAEPENWVKPIRNHYVIVTYFIVPVSEPIAALLFNEQRYA